MSEKRVLTGDLYGLRGWFQGGRCVDHLVVGTVFTVGDNEKGETCLFAYGREYPADAGLVHDALRRSKPA